MMQNSPAITMSNLHITFSRRNLFGPALHNHVLKGINLTLNKGDALGIIGYNGVGKSTLLQVMAGILEPDKGIVTNHGVTAALLNFGGGFFPDCTGRDNIIMALMLQGKTLEGASSLVDEIIEYSELKQAIDAPMKTYSSGMEARLRFATALQSSPDILLVDEVLAVGDLPFRQKSLKSMRAKLSSGETVVFVSHAMPEVREFCTRVVWMEGGRIVADGAANDVVKEYVSFSKKVQDNLAD